MSNFHATLYCDKEVNVLLLAFRGSIELTSFDPNGIIDDWVATNVMQLLGPRPPQYEAAEDVAWEIKERWSLGGFDGRCGFGRPRFVLTGHSKGGGQAQYAAASAANELDAIVFNSTPVNPFTFSDWAVSPYAPLVVQTIYSAAICAGLPDSDQARYSAYFSTGKIRDVRMVNDPLTNYLLPMCGRNWPHAAIEWLVNTSVCSSVNWLAGHLIETVVRELNACIR